MAKLYRTREGDVTALDTKTQLTTVGRETAPGPLLVPAGASTLLGIMAAVGPNFAATGRSNILIRLEGGALPTGPETSVVGAYGVTIATGGQTVQAPVFIPLNIAVTPANELLIFAEMTGVDTGTYSVAVTAVFA